jgi:class 3 adenylate cyclase
LPAALGSLVSRGASIEWQAAQARRDLERYVPPELLEQTSNRGLRPDVSTRRQELTIVFVDMKGFSTLSETAEVEYVGRFLKDFFEGMTGAILKYQGRIHQFLGDGFLAVFGDLVPLEDHADAAVKAGVAMQQEMNTVNSKWTTSGIKEFEVGVKIRVGINTGMVFVGDLGSDRRLEYTVVGSAVNMASRLQALAPPGGIMMTSRTRALLTNPNMCQGPEKVRLKGFERDTDVYTIHPDAIETSQDAN